MRLDFRNLPESGLVTNPGIVLPNSSSELGLSGLVVWDRASRRFVKAAVCGRYESVPKRWYSHFVDMQEMSKQFGTWRTLRIYSSVLVRDIVDRFSLED